MLTPGSARKPRILVVDDEAGLRDMLAILFRREGFDVAVASGLASGKSAIDKSASEGRALFDLVLTDLMMPDGSGIDLLTFVKAKSAESEVIIMTAHSTLETAIDAMKRGAYDFITKPFGTSELRALAHKALEKRAIVIENQHLRAEIAREGERRKDLLGRSEPMRRIVDLIQRVAHSKSTVLITGESGTGKERIARALHDLSDRKDKPFLVVNCGAIPEALMESELFGHEKGSFTGATSRQLGIFREADGGTVLLDEIGELPLSLQVKLLRVLQEKKVRMVGGSAEVSVDVRVLAATNRNVEDDVKANKFRQDLYYRLNVIRIEVPPLRERKEDVGELADAFLRRCAEEHGKPVRAFTADAKRALDQYAFPGNVRELENIVERAVALASAETIGLGDLPREVSGAAAGTTPSLVSLPAEGCNLDDILGEVERRLIVEALERTGGVRTHAAKLLGVTLRSLRYRLQKLALDTGEDGGDPMSDSQITVAPASPTPPGNEGRGA